jgi:dienelactone hydrolase
MEVVYFESGVAPPSPFKLKQAKAKGIEIKQEPGFPISGHLGRPDGGGRFAAIVMLHGCTGISPSNVRWASKFVAWGYVVLLVDSFGPRSESNVCKDPLTIVSMDTRSFDAHGALAYLRTMSFVDPDRIAVAGWSHGGNATLTAMNPSGVTSRLEQRFTAAIAFYPYCLGGTIGAPTLILVGDSDEWVPHKQCEGKKNTELIVYPDTYHGFDAEEWVEGITVEGMNGVQYRLLYNKQAHENAIDRAGEFLHTHLGSD